MEYEQSVDPTVPDKINKPIFGTLEGSSAAMTDLNTIVMEIENDQDATTNFWEQEPTFGTICGQYQTLELEGGIPLFTTLTKDVSDVAVKNKWIFDGKPRSISDVFHPSVLNVYYDIYPALVRKIPFRVKVICTVLNIVPTAKASTDYYIG